MAFSVFVLLNYIGFDIIQSMKTLTFLGDSLDCIRDFPDGMKQAAGYQLHRVQCGEMPSDFKIMTTVGSGVVEIRLKDETGIYRVMYVAKFGDAVYVLHAFQKKTQRTAKPDLDVAKRRYLALIQELNHG